MQTIVVRSAPVFGTGLYRTDALLHDPRVRRRLDTCTPGVAWKWPLRDRALVALAPAWTDRARRFHQENGSDIMAMAGAPCVAEIDRALEAGLRLLLKGSSLVEARQSMKQK